MQKRKERGLTQEELSELIDISKNHISSLERGIYLPTTKIIFSLCNVLGGTPDYYLIGRITPDEENDFLAIIKQFTPKQRKIIEEMLKTYLNEFSKID